ncbi:MAG: PEGA domain-containing protein [Candidatus Methanoperedens sp.]|nr:PEGA domain-containing protein [Candidatus Methanoperedens sp.]CAG0948833.1 hypothetical protein METP1_00060 [Methanosarcinales archaeon]
MRKNGLSDIEKGLMIVGIIVLGVIALPYLSGLTTGAIYGTIPINSNPIGASVTMEGNYLCTTPCSYFSATDMYGKRLTFSKSGFVSQDYVMFSGSAVGVTLVPESGMNYNVLIQSYPSGVSVFDMYDSRLGVTPFSQGIVAGQSMDVYFSKNGYDCGSPRTIAYNSGTVSIICNFIPISTPVPTQPVYTVQPTYPTYTPTYTVQPTYVQPTPITTTPSYYTETPSFIEANMLYITIIIIIGIIIIGLWPTKKGRK